MTEPPRGAALLAAAGLAFSTSSAFAVGNRVIPSTPHGVEKYAQDLTHANSARRRFAARVLRRRARTARRHAARTAGDDLMRAEAQQTLTDFDHLVAPSCTHHLDLPEITAPCADILRLLQTQSAMESLEKQLSVETRSHAQRRLQRAITQIKAVSR